MQLSSVTIGYHHSAPILKDIDAELLEGQFVALIGRNGSGKSTLLRTMARLLEPLSGTIEGPRPAIVLTAMPELRHTTAVEMVAYGRIPFTGFFGRLHDEDYAAAARAIATLGIDDLSTRLFCDLSDGERQKVMIARALAQDSPVMLLDEPAAFLDYPSRVMLMQQLASLAHDSHKAILVSTHEIELAQRHADQLWIIQDRRLRTDVQPSAFDPNSL